MKDDLYDGLEAEIDILKEDIHFFLEDISKLKQALVKSKKVLSFYSKVDNYRDPLNNLIVDRFSSIVQADMGRKAKEMIVDIKNIVKETI